MSEPAVASRGFGWWQRELLAFVVLVAFTVVVGVIRRRLTQRVMRGVGILSYGIYLSHTAIR